MIVIALASAAWAALPSLEWCPFTWLDCVESAQNETECAPSGTPCEAAGPAARCELPCEAAGSGRSCAIPCDPTADPLPFGDRAWCIHPALDAITVRSVDAPPPALQPGIVPAPLEAPMPAAATIAAQDRAVLPPVLMAPHAPPQSRAPPERGFALAGLLRRIAATHA
jgi:hypothetical protein